MTQQQGRMAQRMESAGDRSPLNENGFTKLLVRPRLTAERPEIACRSPDSLLRDNLSLT
jgi:hypothetical protein